MKRIILLVVLLIPLKLLLQAQITTPVIMANFGVDADLRANYFKSKLDNGNDDWFRKDAGAGNFIIDTTGAAYITNRYAVDPAFRMLPFFRGMRYPQFSLINNRILVDGIFIRDHHGDDSTVFASGSNKNAMSPAMWTCPVSQGIPDKTDILDIMMHVRKDGPSVNDSLWMFGGVSIENTTGSRYFDFEMYQTDIYYDRPSRTFKNYGPDFGHTSWKFDAAGKIIQAGDIIFTAEYSSSDLSNVEARIWINKNDLSITPTAFSWGGAFDGDGSGATYGYASIKPKTGGTFYTGIQCGNGEWAGPFKLIRQDNTIATDYLGRQFMEFSVNLSKLGLDPLTASGDPCKMPFRRILIKSRSSTSFTAELKDFVGPFSLFRAPMAEALADVPFFCGTNGVSTITVPNAIATSLYTWETPDGHIATDTIGPEITVDQPGTYIVKQELMDSCGSTYARDTVVITLDPYCTVLKTSVTSFSGTRNAAGSSLKWEVSNNLSTTWYEVEKSNDPIRFSSIARIAKATGYENYSYTYNDTQATDAGPVYYRLKMKDTNGRITYSKIIALTLNESAGNAVRLSPNPAQSETQLVISSDGNTPVEVQVYNAAGKMMHSHKTLVKKGMTVYAIKDLQHWQPGIYIVKTTIGNETFTERLVVNK